ncbi:MAG: DsbA family protein [Pseudomonadota bacterium]
MSALTMVRNLVLKLLLSTQFQQLLRRVRRLKRRWFADDPTIDVYLRLDDPYSLLLVRRLPKLVRAYAVSLAIHLIDDSIPEELEPDPDRLTRFARSDVAMMCAITAEPFDASKELAAQTSGAQALLAEEIANPDSQAQLAGLLGIFEAYWGGDLAAIKPRLDRLNSIVLEKSRQTHRNGVKALVEGGHYRPATLQFEGEWFWGIDRLHFLLSRCDAQGLARKGESQARVDLKADIEAINPCELADLSVPEGQVLDVYFSFRSPYSYLALQRIQTLQESSGLQYRLRPVLPMVKRGLAVPRSKGFEIVKDTAREASRNKIPFGNLVDPLQAVEELLGLFVRAEASDCAMRFSLAVLRAAWAGGVDLTDQRQRTRLLQEQGLALSTPCTDAQLEAGMALALENRERLTALDLWGVPAYHINGHKSWGQDRLVLLLQAANNEEAEN